jgi:hypothetical protein
MVWHAEFLKILKTKLIHVKQLAAHMVKETASSVYKATPTYKRTWTAFKKL